MPSSFRNTEMHLFSRDYIRGLGWVGGYSTAMLEIDLGGFPRKKIPSAKVNGSRSPSMHVDRGGWDWWLSHARERSKSQSQQGQAWALHPGHGHVTCAAIQGPTPGWMLCSHHLAVLHNISIRGFIISWCSGLYLCSQSLSRFCVSLGSYLTLWLKRDPESMHMIVVPYS